MADTPEFDLTIQALTQGYTVSLRATAEVDLPPQAIAFQFPALPHYGEIARFVAAAREARLSGATEVRDAQQVGGLLFQAIFPPEVLARFRAAREAIPTQGRLSIRLRLPATLSAIPWELLYDATNDQFLALADDLALVRCPELATPLRPLQLDGPLQVVVVLASPRGVRPIDLDRELERVQAALRRPLATGQVALDVIRGPGTYDQLRDRLDSPVHVLHVLCHGDLDEERGEGVLLFEDIGGDKETIGSAQLRLLIEKQRGQTRLVVLNSCLGAVSGGNNPFGSVGAALMQGGVPAVLAMQFEFPAESANELARILYADLVKGRPIGVALTEARRHLYGIDTYRLDWAIPVLFLRGNDGALFSRAGAIAKSKPAPHLQPPIEPARVTAPSPLSATELRSLSQRATGAYYGRRWADAELLLTQLAAADPTDTETDERLRTVILYRDVAAFRESGDWEAVLGALDALAREQPSFGDPDRHRVWAEARQQRDDAYQRALAACDTQDWAAVQAVLGPFAAEQPDDVDIVALLQRAREELAEQERQAREAPARKRAEEERQRKAARVAAQQQAEEEQQRKAAEVAAQQKAEKENQRKATKGAEVLENAPIIQIDSSIDELAAQYNALYGFLLNKDWQNADNESIRIIRDASGHELIDSQAKAQLIPDQVLRDLNQLWVAMGDGKLRRRAWVFSAKGVTTYVAWHSFDTWLSKRFDELGLA